VVLCWVSIAALTFVNIRNTVTIYYFENVVPGGQSYFGPVMTTGAIAFILGVMATSPLAKRFGKRNFYLVSMSVTALLTIGFYFVPPENIKLVWAANTIINFCAAPTAPLVWAMYADTADYSEWKSGRRATGLVFSAASLAQKFGWAIGGAGAGWLLAYFGYMPNVAQSPRTVHGIIMMMSIIPAIAAVVAVSALWFYEIDEPTVKQMSADLEARRGPEPVDEPLPATAVVPPAVASIVQTAAPKFEVESERKPERAAPGLEEGGPGATGHRRAPSAPRIPVLAGAPRAASPGEASPLSAQALADLQGEFSETLQAGVHGLCFSPYLEGQAPGSQIEQDQIRARLGIIRPYTNWARTFSCTDGHEQTPRIAQEMGLKTLVGAWLGTDREVNEREIAGAIELARAGHADILAVGNEVLLREDLSEDELLAYLQRVRQAVPAGVPVGYVDAYYLFERHPRITAACDVVLTNCYPFWEGCPRDQAIAYMQSMYQRTVAVAAGKKVIISETGWPHTGTAFHGAVPSVEGAMRYFIDTYRWARRDGVEVFYFEAFDEAWKVGAEGDVGAYWGLWDTNGLPKYV
jgi:exo-beta-1,3-glucanase (GH17 family)